nr:hypothetical protein [Tanacetum cinerariifolium]
MPTKIELTMEQSQQGVSNDVLVSIERVEELKTNVCIKGENKAAFHYTLGRNWVNTYAIRFTKMNSDTCPRDGKEIVINESSVRRDLQLVDEEDEAVHKELGDILVWAATTASSLEAKHDSGGGLRCQETVRDTTSQTRVLDLEITKTTQRNEIDSLKRRVKKLKRINRSRTHKLKRLYKVSLTARVESSDNEEILGKDASKQGKIDAIDADEDITLVNDAEKEMFDVDDLGGEEVFVAGKNDNVVEEVVNAAQVSTTTTTIIITTKEITLAQALKALKNSKLKLKGIIFQDPYKYTTTIISSQQSQDKGKRVMIEEHVKSNKTDQIRLDEEASLKLQAEFDEEERLARERVEKEQEANISLIET